MLDENVTRKLHKMAPSSQGGISFFILWEPAGHFLTFAQNSGISDNECDRISVIWRNLRGFSVSSRIPTLHQAFEHFLCSCHEFYGI